MLQHAYRALKFLAAVGSELEARLTRVMTERLFAADASLVLFDTTSRDVEGMDRQGDCDGSGEGEGWASFGFSRDRRAGRPHQNLGLLTSREGPPLGHRLFPGRQSDIKSMSEVSHQFQAWLALGSFVVVADRRMIRAANLESFRAEGIS